ncbi:thermonuclease family protein [Parvularcula dongshanensis]|uniref:Endonuclease YncB(Thermonuclease family) n=1 Tax=Parvularcula dongshanensis TaxID=1173995 RepID=A0A840I1W9_9PROT|nr:thermonuclease family protein [Parvularcula dongshanensis]MBB4658188.1 endonuclease YncB(thermonuclease family) [Parvularcula dongshanensis]
MRRAVYLLLGLAVLAACWRAGGGDKPESSVRVIDGDTVVWQGRTADLYGIDAPELGQRCLSGTHLYPCGLDAAHALEKRTLLDELSCEPAPARADELVCGSADQSLGDLQLADGYAYAVDGAPAAQRALADEARTARLGVWRGEHVQPAAWRAGERLAAEEREPQACPIIGTVRNGRRIYLVPSDRDYDDVRVLAGTRRFCSDEAARESGAVHVEAR